MEAREVRIEGLKLLGVFDSYIEILKKADRQNGHLAMVGNKGYIFMLGRWRKFFSMPPAYENTEQLINEFEKNYEQRREKDD